ncbi:hypothetical protein vBSeyj11_130 [Salmonella phage vB Seyj1-1]|uniref:Uncharacterized protein n=1 Tax=Salmonella phage vB Seyj1-1 TaxID=2801511 RepID=A0A7U0G9P3_9CAUD|nr:hypothetical protein vBSeyj11_130 [Salmonella phage vB Seyj1-1]
MIKTPVPIFGFPSIEEFKEYLDKNFYNEQPVTLLKSDLSELLDMIIKETSEKEPEQKAEKEPEQKAEKKTSKKSDKKTEKSE